MPGENRRHGRDVSKPIAANALLTAIERTLETSKIPVLSRV